MTDEISANDKLIKLIRSKDEAGGASNQRTETISQIQTVQSSKKLWRLSRNHVFGIDIGMDALKIAKVTNGADSRRSLVGFSIVPYTTARPGQAREFAQFLRSQIKRLGNLAGAEIWCTFYVADIDIRYFKIPKVPRKQLSNTAYWTYQKIKPFDGNDRIFDFQVLKTSTESTDDRLAVVAYTVPKVRVERIKGLFTRVGLPLAGLISYPFAYQNIFRKHPDLTEGELSCSLHVGRDASRIDLFLPDGSVIYSRSIKTAMRSMAQAIADAVGEMTSADLLEDEFLRRQSVDKNRLAEGWEILDDFIRSDPSVERVSDRLAPNISHSDLHQVIQPAIRRMAWQIERTLDYVMAAIGEKTVGKLFMSGGLMDSDEIVRSLEDELDSFSGIYKIDPFNMGIQILEGLTPSEKLAERSVFTPAIGAAMSAKFITPNFLFTFKEKAGYYRRRYINRSIWITLVVLSVVTVGVFSWQRYLIDRNETKIVEIEQRLKYQVFQDGIFVNEPFIERRLLELNRKKAAAKVLARRESGLVILEEIAAETPENIRMMKINIELGNATPRNSGGDAPKIDLEGVVLGDMAMFETTLMAWLENLRQKPIFGPFVVKRKAEDTLEGRRVLRFVVSMALTV